MESLPEEIQRRAMSINASIAVSLFILLIAVSGQEQQQLQQQEQKEQSFVAGDADMMMMTESSSGGGKKDSFASEDIDDASSSVISSEEDTGDQLGEPEGESSLTEDMMMMGKPEGEEENDDSSLPAADPPAAIESPSSSHDQVEEEGMRSCSFDGTTCQFSACGQGRKLTRCVIGFASGVTGGARGIGYVVINPSDNPQHPQPGSFRYGVMLANRLNGGVWITFARSMEIVLKDMVWIRSSTTVDGRGANIIFKNKCLALGRVSNVILHNFQINHVPNTDTIHIFGGSRKIWVDHITSFDAKLGLVSVVQGSTDATISNCFLRNHNFNMLLGASDTDSQDREMRVTVFRNWFRDSMQRMPHCRWGYCHVINNVYTNWGYYAIGARAHAQVLSESNVFMAGRKREVTPWFRGGKRALDQSSTIQSRNDLFLNGSTFHQFTRLGTAAAPKYVIPRHFPPVAPPHFLVKLVQSCAGNLFGRKLHRCLYA